MDDFETHANIGKKVKDIIIKRQERESHYHEQLIFSEVGRKLIQTAVEIGSLIDTLEMAHDLNANIWGNRRAVGVGNYQVAPVVKDCWARVYEIYNDDEVFMLLPQYITQLNEMRENVLDYAQKALRCKQYDTFLNDEYLLMHHYICTEQPPGHGRIILYEQESNMPESSKVVDVMDEVSQAIDRINAQNSEKEKSTEEAKQDTPNRDVMELDNAMQHFQFFADDNKKEPNLIFTENNELNRNAYFGASLLHELMHLKKARIIIDYDADYPMFVWQVINKADNR